MIEIIIGFLCGLAGSLIGGGLTIAFFKYKEYRRDKKLKSVKAPNLTVGGYITKSHVDKNGVRIIDGLTLTHISMDKPPPEILHKDLGEDL